MDPVADALQLATFEQLVNEIGARTSDALICVHGLPGTNPNTSKLISSSLSWQDDVALHLTKDRIRREAAHD